MLEVAPLAFFSALALTPLARRLARATGYVDDPAARKAHAQSTPLLGGAAVAAALVIAPLLARAMGASPIAAPTTGVVVGALIALALGLIDDRRPLGPKSKLLGQLLAGACLVYWGTSVPELRLNPILGILAVVAVAALLNAMNFLDNMDGILGALVPVTACGFAALALIHGTPVDLGLAFGLIGACAGFLVYNAPPARIFLGDAGSHLLGFSLAALALQSLQGSFTLPHLAAVLLILAYPIFDATFVVWDRVVGRRPFYVGGTDHTTHRLGKRFGKWGTIAIVSLASSLNAWLGVWTWGRSDALSIVCVLCVSALGYALFGTVLRHISPTTQFVT
ncbi:MAG TPA: MraY family glycosyltransferase [Candidatus Dormibacteraeota bacterium]|nr:MraY family glycosyltransferase [Candidatus Dormibacteraeota bacterium]